MCAKCLILSPIFLSAYKPKIKYYSQLQVGAARPCKMLSLQNVSYAIEENY